jgi:type IV pilus assembly protein PilV
VKRWPANGPIAARQTGFSLIEVLIAVLILVIGLVGVAHMQAMGLTNTQSAYNRSQATLLAYDMADRMRANLASIDTYVDLAPADASLQDACYTTDGCTVAQMAENDLYQWSETLGNFLPGGAGAIAVDDMGTAEVEDDLYTVSVSWNDNADGSTGDPEPNPTFSFSFRPLLGG